MTLQQAPDGAAAADRHGADSRDSQRFPGTLPVTRLTDVEAQLDMRRLRGYRLGRVRQELKRRGIVPACCSTRSTSATRRDGATRPSS